MSWMEKDQSIPMVLDEVLVAFFLLPACSKAQGLGSPKPATTAVHRWLNRDMHADQVHLSQKPGSPGQIQIQGIGACLWLSASCRSDGVGGG